MMGILETFIVFLALAVLQVLPQTLYYVMMKSASRRPYNIKMDPNYRPSVTIIVPTYQEADVIEAKLANLNSLMYPEDKLEVIIVDSASTDGTLDKCRNWLSKNQFRFKIHLLSETKRISKAHALNYALKYAKGEVIVTTDADAILSPDILLKALPFLADPSVAAVSGREVIANSNRCFLAKMESTYRDIYYTLRLGESKIHSAQIFQGEFAAYKRGLLKLFVDEPGRADDNGTVTELLSKGLRCLFIPEAIFHDAIPCSLRDYLGIKIRRASHLLREFSMRLRLWFKGKIRVPLWILAVNIYQHMIAPPLFIPLILVGVYFMFQLYQLSLLYLIVVTLSILAVAYRLRYTIALYMISNTTLLTALISLLSRKKETAWKAVRSSRRIITANNA